MIALGLPGRGQREADVQRAAGEGGDQGEGAAQGGGQEDEKSGGRAKVCFFPPSRILAFIQGTVSLDFLTLVCL